MSAFTRVFVSVQGSGTARCRSGISHLQCGTSCCIACEERDGGSRTNDSGHQLVTNGGRH